MNIQSSNDFGENNLKILVYGSSGAGKTYLTRTIEEPVLVLSCESGLLSLSGADIDVVDATKNDDGTLASSEEKLNTIRTFLNYIQQDTVKAVYKWIVIDSLTEISQVLHESLLKEFSDRKDSLVLYGELSKRTRGLVKAFRDLSHYNVVFTALAEDDKDELGRRYKNISMIGKASQWLPSLVDEVFFLHTFENEEGITQRNLITRASDKVIAKDRSGKLNQTENCNLQEIANKIRGVKNEQPMVRPEPNRSVQRDV